MSGILAALALDAPAKVNLFLRVVGKRDDGYHDIETIFQAVALADRVVAQRVDEGVSLDVRGADLGPVEENLAHRAARALLDATGSSKGLRIHLDKRIPAGAGMGGGSSDAAAVLRVGNALLGEPLGAEDLSALGASLGSDVPFFLGPSALAWGRGRGERLEPLPPLPAASVVVVIPPVHVATAGAYAALARVRMVGNEPPCAEALPGAPSSWAEVAASACNDFESTIPAAHPRVDRALSALREVGAAPGLLSGSGGACFGVFAVRSDAERAARSLQERLGWPVEVTHTLAAIPEPVPAGAL